MVKNLLCNAGDTSSIRGPGRSHMPHRNTHMHTVGWNRCSRPAFCTPIVNPRGGMPSLWSIMVSLGPSTMHRAGLGVLTSPMGRTRLLNPSLPSRGFGKVRYIKKKWRLFPPISSLLTHSLSFPHPLPSFPPSYILCSPLSSSSSPFSLPLPHVTPSSQSSAPSKAN